MLCVFVSREMSDIYYRYTSLPITCSKSDTSLGTSVAQSPSVILSRHCGKRLLDRVDTSRGLALGKQREEKGKVIDSDCNAVSQSQDFTVVNQTLRPRGALSFVTVRDTKFLFRRRGLKFCSNLRSKSYDKHPNHF